MIHSPLYWHFSNNNGDHTLLIISSLILNSKSMKCIKKHVMVTRHDVMPGLGRQGLLFLQEELLGR